MSNLPDRPGLPTPSVKNEEQDHSDDDSGMDYRSGEDDDMDDEATLDARRKALPERPFAPESQSPWQEIFREKVEQFSEGMVLRGAPAYQDIARTKGVPRDNH